MGCERYRKVEMIDLLYALERRPPTQDRLAVLARSRRAFESGPKTCPAEPTSRRSMSFHRPASRDGMNVSEVGVPATAPGATFRVYVETSGAPGPTRRGEKRHRSDQHVGNRERGFPRTDRVGPDIDRTGGVPSPFPHRVRSPDSSTNSSRR